MLTAIVRFHRIVQIKARFGMEQISFDIPAVEGDVGPVFHFTCVNMDGLPVDLTAKTVQLFIKRSGAASSSNLSKTCVIVTPAAGIAEYTPGIGDFAEAGTYFGDLVITSGLLKETCPSAIRLVVRPSNT